jgi:DMSO/TMAO reductase YedYZ molybdopterin-dependent catalytic subunit
MKNRFSRRRFLTAGLAAAASASGIAAVARIANRYGLIPPDHSGIYGIGETLTYASQRLLMSVHSQAREFERRQVSEIPIVNGNPPQNETYQRFVRGRFADWKLTVDGLVARPSSFSLADLKGYPSRTQITQLACEEGWSFIAEWIGVPLSHVLNLVGVLPQAKYVV